MAKRDSYPNMDMPNFGPTERELDALGLTPASIELATRQDVFSLDTLFTSMSETHDLTRGLTITGSIPSAATIDGVLHEDCRVLFIKDDCAVLEYGADSGSGGRLDVMVVRQDLKRIIRPIQLLPNFPIAASVQAPDLVDKFRAADDLLQAVENVVDNS